MKNRRTGESNEEARGQRDQRLNGADLRKNTKTKTKMGRNMQRLGGRGLSLEAFANVESGSSTYNPSLIKKQREFYKNAKYVRKYKKSLKQDEQQQNPIPNAKFLKELDQYGNEGNAPINQKMKENKKKAMEDFTLLKELYSHVSSSSSSVKSYAIHNDKELFVEACGSFKNGLAFGFGSESPLIKSQLNELASPTPIMIELANNVAELKELVKEMKEKLKEKDNKYKDICKYLKQIAKHAGSSSLPPVPSILIEGDDDTLADNPS